MALERVDYYRDLQPLHDKCRKCMYYHTMLTMTDGSTIDGIIEEVDNDRVTVLVGEDVMEQDDENQYDEQRNDYGYRRPPRRRFRRFRRRRFPLGNLAAISLLAYPYFVPPYPFYPYY